MSDINSQYDETRLRWTSFIPVFIICLIIIIGGYAVYKNEKKSIIANEQEELKAVSELKISQIEDWMKERYGDIVVTAGSPLFSQTISQFIANHDDQILKEKILDRLWLTKTSYGYQDILVIKPDGELVISTNPVDEQICDHTKAIITVATNNKSVIFSDFYYCNFHDQIHLDFVSPIIENGLSEAALVFRIDPYDFLYPFIQTWPTLSKTSETLILEREGDSLVYLNELRNRRNTPLNYKLPLNNEQIPAVMSVHGYTGMFEGEDYRGEKVFSYIDSIPGTKWKMVTKIDKKETLRELYFRAVLIGLFAVLLVILVGVFFLLKFKNRQADILRRLFNKEIELRKQEEESKVVLYSIGDAVITTDKNGTITRMNVIAEQLTGWSENESKGLPVEKVFRIKNEESKIKAENPAEKVLREGNIVGLANNTLLISKNGDEIPIADSGAPIKDENGERIGVVLVFRDQTEERSARRALIESEGNFRNLFEHSAAGISMTELDGSIHVNKSFCDMLGYTEEELMSINWATLTHPDDIEGSNQILESLLKGEKSMVSYEKRYICKNGGIVWANLNTFLQRDNEGNPKYYITNVVDITDLKKAVEITEHLNDVLETKVAERTEQLENINKELEAFSYSVSHDLRAPLGHINGYIDLLVDRFSDSLPEKAKYYISTIAGSAKEMGELIDDLLQFSRNNRQEMRLSNFNMGQLVQQIVDSISVDNPTRKIEWSVSGLPDVYGDYNLLKLVWTNLVGNAVKFTRIREVAEIEINSYKEGEETVFYIRDNGAGFDMKFSQKLFGVFQRLHTSSEFEGTGIGLANVRRIILKHGGRTWAEGKVDNGATIFFSIPKNKEKK